MHGKTVYKLIFYWIYQRTRKAEKFRAILSESENSDDEFKGDSSKKSSTRVVSSNKTKFKKNKLKLGGKAKPGESSGNLTILKPFPLEAEVDYPKTLHLQLMQIELITDSSREELYPYNITTGF